ncbi:MAG TPA: hypothetical protein DEP42_04915, partial [Ruminococcaceae bacterium]|nr:hypothetical protein [Oscillospiraceae bacterium]
MALVASEFDKNDRSQAALSAQSGVLSQSIENQESKLALLNAQYDKQNTKLASLAAELASAGTEFGENSAEAAQAQNAYDRQAQSVSKLQQAINTTSGNLNNMKSAISSNAAAMQQEESATSKLNSSIATQQTKLDSLKSAYTSTVIEEGKTSTSAQELAKEIETLSSDLAKSKTQLEDASGAADKLDKSMDSTEKSANTAGSGGFTVMKAALGNLVSNGIQGAISGIENLGKSAVSYNASMQTYQTGFETMTGSASKASQIMQQISSMAADTPFEIPELADTTTQLMNYGFTADQAMSSMSMLGDISQGNADKMDSITMAYGQMSSAGKVQLEDVKQMIEAGFNPLQEISKSTGESMQSLYSRISNGTLSVDEITASMKRSTSAGGLYFQSMDKQSKTLSGRFATLKDDITKKFGDALGGATGKLATEVLPNLDKAIQSIDTKSLTDGITKAAEAAANIITFLSQHAGVVLSTVAAIGAAFLTWKITGVVTGIVSGIQSLITSLRSAKTAQEGLNVAAEANPWGILITIIVTLATLFISLYNNCKPFRNFIQSVGGIFQKMGTELLPVLQLIGSTIASVFMGAVTVVQTVWSGIVLFFQTIWN